MSGPYPKGSPERRGTLAAFATYAMWGLFPLYWKHLSAVDSIQILCHRVVWSMAFLLVLLAASRRLGDFISVFRSGKRAVAVAASGLLITANWGIYILAINTGRVSESSLGYFINPLLSVALGALLFRERLDRWTVSAVGIAGVGVAVASIMMGRLPWMSLALGATSALYGAIKKGTGLDPIAGLGAETLAMTPLAIAWLAFAHRAGRGAFGGLGAGIDILLIGGGVVTAVTYLVFAYATNNISLQRMGFIQYLSPSIQLVLSLFVYREGLTAPRAVAFASVIAAVLLYVTTRRFAAKRA